VGWCLKTIYTWGKGFWWEFRHCVGGYRFLRTQDLLIVSGGGQLDDEWGGPWCHPFALFKWAILARITRVPCVIASVGACKATSATSRFFLSTTLRMARYRSYRDKNSREIAAGLLPRGVGDSIVPDLAFSLPSSELPPPAGIRAIWQGRKLVALSPMAFAKPGSWPYEDRALYERYLQQMARVTSLLLERGYFLVILYSALLDASVIPEILALLDYESEKKLAQQVRIPMITAWKELVALLLDVDFLVASRLHSAILGFLVQVPTVAISFDPKVDWLMEDLGQAEYLLQIRDFTAEDVIETLHRLELRRNLVMEQIASYRQRIVPACTLQYDALAGLARASRRHN
jgi:polysaccharide pyruvyl transferase WcaK-like protein